MIRGRPYPAPAVGDRFTAIESAIGSTAVAEQQLVLYDTAPSVKSLTENESKQLSQTAAAAVVIPNPLSIRSLIEKSSASNRALLLVFGSWS